MAEELKGHWTNRDTQRFVFSIGFDFATQIDKAIKAKGLNREKFATALKRTKGRVSQLLNNPGNLRLETMVEMARTLGLKVAVVAYNDNDQSNKNGPINAEIFEQCWNDCGKPTEFSADAWLDFDSTVSLRYSTTRNINTAVWITDWASDETESQPADIRVPPELIAEKFEQVIRTSMGGRS